MVLVFSVKAIKIRVFTIIWLKKINDCYEKQYVVIIFVSPLMN